MQSHGTGPDRHSAPACSAGAAICVGPLSLRRPGASRSRLTIGATAKRRCSFVHQSVRSPILIRTAAHCRCSFRIGIAPHLAPGAGSPSPHSVRPPCRLVRGKAIPCPPAQHGFHALTFAHPTTSSQRARNPERPNSAAKAPGTAHALAVGQGTRGGSMCASFVSAHCPTPQPLPPAPRAPCRSRGGRRKLGLHPGGGRVGLARPVVQMGARVFQPAYHPPFPGDGRFPGNLGPG